MSKRPRWLVFVSLGAVVLLIFAVVGALLRANGPESLGAKLGLPHVEEAEQESEASSEDESADAEGLTETENASSSTRKKPKVKDVPTPPATTDPATAAWQKYLADTKAVVDNNEASLRAAVDEFTAALTADDGAAIEQMLAPDEGAAGYGNELASKWPAIRTSAPLPTVNVFTTGQATVYFAYILVTWEDAGIVSEHTIPIMFRFVNGEWVITVLGETGSDLTFVQKLTL